MKEPIKHRLKRLAFEIPFRVFSPRWWHLTSRYDYEWDVFVETSLNLGMVKADQKWFFSHPRADHVLLVGEKEMWVSNYPYAYATPHEDIMVGGGESRPSIRTMLRIRKLQAELQREISAQIKAKIVEEINAKIQGNHNP